MINISNRQKELIKYIWNRRKRITGKELAVFFSVTPRTIRTDIKNINAKERIIHSSGRGYFILKDQDKTIKSILNNKNAPVQQFERVNYILKKLLIAKNKLDVYEIAEEIYVSEATLEKDLKMLSNVLNEKYKNLGICKKGSKFYITGGEKDKRLLMSQLLFKELKGNLLNLSNFQIHFKYDLPKIKQTVLSILSKNKFHVRDVSINNLIIHIAITMERIEKENFLKSGISVNEDSEEYKVAIDICNSIKNEFNIDFPQKEVKYIGFLLIGKKVIESTFSSRLEFYRNIPIEYVKRIESIVEDTCKEFRINFLEDEELIIGLTLHMKLMHERLEKKALNRKNILEDLKLEYPIIFEIAVFVCKKFYETMGFEAEEIEEGEVAFIALHFGASYERRFKKNKLLRVALVCPTGYMTSNILLEKLNRLYKRRIEIEDVYSIMDLESIDKTKVDYIFSTVELGADIDIPVLVVSTFLLDKDFKNIDRIIKHFEFKNTLEIEKYFDPRFFHIKNTFKNMFEAISFMTEKLEVNNIVPENYKELVMERELIAPTSFGNLVALPHAVELNAYKTVFSVVILKKPIKWGKHNVQLIFMGAIKKGERKMLNKLINHITQILEDPKSINQLIKISNYNEFIKKIGKLPSED
ncbi:BglG family transcription antiterminator [Crassaminicella profunda]|uniref:BglG family transcription antiterminator n=1 Tax=Crassaminicella profunda TaxID=1286698 RepID=UPI001CA63D2A|nr:PTS sugar transporter subunit IIA [Crassaminicella profunda]QZY55809.1 PTS sugar transporter subunit IIA [Crassaminicella profunda]